MAAPPPVRSELAPRIVRDAASETARADAAAALRRANTILLSSHEKVDGDGAGSALGLAHGLRSLGKRALAAFPTPLPADLAFLPGGAEAPVVASPADLPGEFAAPDLFVSLDCGAASRLGALRGPAEAARLFLNVDHHASNEGFGNLHWIDPSYAAAGTMAFELLCELGVLLDRTACLCLYAALVVDTGGFAYSNTDPRSHRMAAFCIERGVKPEEVTRSLRRERSLGSLRLEAEAVARLKATEDGTVAWTSLTREMLRRHGVGPGEVPELVHLPVSLRETRIAFLLTEMEGGGTRVSLRSRCPVGVHSLAEAYGGGGHPRAAGMSLPGDLAAAETEVLGAVGRALEEWRAHRGRESPPPQDA